MKKPKHRPPQKSAFLNNACLAVPWNLGELIADALNPDYAPRPVRRLADFTREECERLTVRYGCEVRT